MVEVRWSPQAADDLEAIRDYIGKDSPSYAAIFGEKIVAAVESLSYNPERGRIVPETNDPSTREVFLKKYRIIYHVSDEAVEVLTIIHGSRDLSKIKI
ncbi:MAG: type II toxin-antitoxin system RelE/ParE family toxin [Candidatus Lokiarchaeota archaeon]|nr:type II toxin-antitoxin system RelE/ParE family toxin [Candidatus Lokiarchaeota archaeon]